eukprot:9357186-Pyramimonas_sp.AAC.1
MSAGCIGIQTKVSRNAQIFSIHTAALFSSPSVLPIHSLPYLSTGAAPPLLAPPLWFEAPSPRRSPTLGRVHAQLEACRNQLRAPRTPFAIP